MKEKLEDIFDIKLIQKNTLESDCGEITFNEHKSNDKIVFELNAKIPVADDWDGENIWYFLRKTREFLDAIEGEIG